MVRADVERPGIEFRQDERRAPVPAERAHRGSLGAPASAAATTAEYAAAAAALSWRRSCRRLAPGAILLRLLDFRRDVGVVVDDVHALARTDRLALPRRPI